MPEKKDPLRFCYSFHCDRVTRLSSYCHACADSMENEGRSAEAIEEDKLQCAEVINSTRADIRSCQTKVIKEYLPGLLELAKAFSDGVREIDRLSDSTVGSLYSVAVQTDALHSRIMDRIERDRLRKNKGPNKPVEEVPF